MPGSLLGSEHLAVTKTNLAVLPRHLILRFSELVLRMENDPQTAFPLACWSQLLPALVRRSEFCQPVVRPLVAWNQTQIFAPWKSAKPHQPQSQFISTLLPESLPCPPADPRRADNWLQPILTERASCLNITLTRLRAHLSSLHLPLLLKLPF